MVAAPETKTEVVPTEVEKAPVSADELKKAVAAEKEEKPAVEDMDQSEAGGSKELDAKDRLARQNCQWRLTLFILKLSIVSNSKPKNACSSIVVVFNFYNVVHEGLT